MRYERTYSGNVHLPLEQIEDHLRVGTDDLSALYCADAAAREIEEYCGLALLDQTITVTTDAWPGAIVSLPIGPVQSGATATVAVLELDGSETPVPSAFWLEGGRYPRLHFTETEPGGRLRISYQAGFGSQPYAIPADLRHAVADQAARLFDMRGAEDGKPTLAPAAARIAARWRRVRIDG